MNVSTGGPHILLFERDQQLAALLTSEFQLAGYECHVARTAVEVFDAIARHPVRLVVVNLAQAASGRREFWVALDAQRRGRGVQVFTFRCTNLAGYGAYDPDEQNQAVLADLEIDGMLGIMNLVDAVRARLPLPGANMASSGHFPAAPPPTPAFAATPTAPLASIPTNSGQMPAMAPPASQSGYAPGNSAMRQAPPAYTQSAHQPAYVPTSQQAASNYASPPAQATYMPPSSPLTSQNQGAPVSAQSPMGFTDKIRAVIYPGSRSFSPVQQPEATWNAQYNNAQAQSIHGSVPPPVYQPQPPQQPAPTYQQPVQQQPAPTYQQPAPQQPAPVYQQPTQQQQAPVYQQPAPQQVPVYQQPQQVPARPPQPQPQPVYPRNQPAQTATNQGESYMYAVPAPQPPQSAPAPSQPAMAVNESSLEQLSRLLEQFSPAAGRENNGGQQPANATRTQDTGQAPPPQPQMRPTDADAPPISSMPLRPAPIQDIPPAREQESRSERFDARGANTQTPYAATSTPTSELTSIRMVVPPPEPAQSNQDYTLSYTEKKPRDRGGEEYAINNGRDERAQETRQQPAEQEEMTPDIMLLDIMQSLPPMAPATQPTEPPPVLNGRATRALGNVLLEGHLVPQDRLEVAQNVQRMLRGVDLNYQLGEILLMFKLLTPDQLLAASLVSYGLITTAQIRSLGRIRQELHSMGLEYDLENLLILFRILTPEQLREVRASWST
ncbi:MAG: hypothetical protein M3Y81_28405 [Chloroflexota bacterium]|nr:hypothetical protein [Chloroflexota bacterium]